MPHQVEGYNVLARPLNEMSLTPRSGITLQRPLLSGRSWGGEHHVRLACHSATSSRLERLRTPEKGHCHVSSFHIKQEASLPIHVQLLLDHPVLN